MRFGTRVLANRAMGSWKIGQPGRGDWKGEQASSGPGSDGSAVARRLSLVGRQAARTVSCKHQRSKGSGRRAPDCLFVLPMHRKQKVACCRARTKVQCWLAAEQ